VTPKQRLSEASLRLKRAAPEEWRLFVETFAAFTDETVSSLTDADPSLLQIAQGQARQTRTLARLFNECDRPQQRLQRPPGSCTP